MIKKVALVIGGIFLCILSILAFIGVYKFIFSLLKPNVHPTFLGYSDYIVQMDTEGIYNKGDLVIVKKDILYESGTYILYQYNGSLMIDEVINISLDNYTVKSNRVVDYSNIIGKSIYNIANFENIYNIITNPLTFTLIIVGTGIYFYLFVKGKVK